MHTTVSMRSGVYLSALCQLFTIKLDEDAAGKGAAGPFWGLADDWADWISPPAANCADEWLTYIAYI